MRPTWIFTVPSDRNKLAAISLLDMPAAMREKTSCSRPVRVCRSWAAGWLLAGPGGELAGQAVGGGRPEDGVAGGDGPDRGDQAGGLGVLEQEAAGAGPQPGVDVIVKVEGGQDQHL